MPNKTNTITPTTTSKHNSRSQTLSGTQLLPISPSNSDLMQAILNMKTFQSTQFEELRGCLARLTDDVSHLHKENASPRAELPSLKTRFDNLDIGSFNSLTVGLAAQLLRETSESSKRAFNVIIYGIAESCYTTAELRITDDNAEVSRVLWSIYP